MDVFDKNEAAQDDLDDILNDEDLGADDDALAAPPRTAKKSGGGRAKLLATVALLLAAGAGGGYYYLISMAEGDFAPPRQIAAAQPVAAPAPASVGAPVVPDMPSVVEDASATPAVPAGMEDAPLLSQSGDLDIPPPEDLLADISAVPPNDAAGEAVLGIPEEAAVVDVGAETETAMPVETVPEETATLAPSVAVAVGEDIPADLDLIPPPADALAEPVMPVPAAVPEEGVAALVAEAEVPPAPVIESESDVGAMIEPAMDLPLPEELLAAPPQPAPEALPVTEDLPMPEDTAALPETDAPDAASAAETALLNNISELQELSVPEEGLAALPDMGEVPSQKAIVRPLPPQYMQIQKDRTAADKDSRLTSARAALLQGNNKAALELFTELGRDYPQDESVMMGRAVSMQKLGMDEDALAAYEDVLRANPKNLEALTNMLGLVRAQDPTLSLEKLKELRTTYPANADITAQLGIAYGAAAEYESALRYLDMAAALGAGEGYVLFNKAVVYDRMGQGAHAANLYRNVLTRASEGALKEQLPLQAIRDRLAVLR
ncbi:MAG: tetratricopeptide repeat protein [Alphaproteobacteria bacterium]|nr:tetratricopeptide repeat protein [Alphaproteobacteria bacterium]